MLKMTGIANLNLLRMHNRINGMETMANFEAQNISL